jgi:SAM-dependent methyltransferase
MTHQKYNRQHYCTEYDDLKRFISYYYQANLIKELGVKRILEIGIGNKTLSDYLTRRGVEVTTCDFNEDLEPDYVADIRKLPFENNSFEAVAAFEILEHLPWDQSQVALKELHRVSKRHVIISVPRICFYFEMALRFPLINKIFKRTYLDFFVHIPFSFFQKCPPFHEWEIGRTHYPLRKIRTALRKHFNIRKEVRPILNPLHYFFILEKKSLEQTKLP